MYLCKPLLYLSPRHVYMILGGIWFISILSPTVWISLGSCACYDTASLSCLSSTQYDYPALFMTGTSILVGIPLMVVVVCNVFLLYVAIASQQRLKSDLSM